MTHPPDPWQLKNAFFKKRDVMKCYSGTFIFDFPVFEFPLYIFFQVGGEVAVRGRKMKGSRRKGAEERGR